MCVEPYYMHTTWERNGFKMQHGQINHNNCKNQVRFYTNFTHKTTKLAESSVQLKPLMLMDEEEPWCSKLFTTQSITITIMFHQWDKTDDEYTHHDRNGLVTFELLGGAFCNKHKQKKLICYTAIAKNFQKQNFRVDYFIFSITLPRRTSLAHRS